MTNPINSGGIGLAPGDLLSAKAVRDRAGLIYAAGLAGRLEHFAIDEGRLDATAAYVADTIRANYPGLRIPIHSRWRHLDANGASWETRLGENLSRDRVERARQRIELAVASVLLDAGAGPHWRWRDAVTGREFARSEGLALASLEAFRAGLFSSDPDHPCRADATGLANISQVRLAELFQVSERNPLVGVDGRVALLARLGAAIAAHPLIYGRAPRVGGLYDHALSLAHDGEIALPRVLEILLATLGSIWPGRLTLGGLQLGDTWQHPAIDVAGPTRALMPLHKLSQWLTYSLIEPLEEAGLKVTDIDGLTGLAEYRNGGLFIDMGVITPRRADLAATPLMPGDEPVVEWRALTVALLDAIAPRVRAKLGPQAEHLSLASILEGGTWAAGRRIAAEQRAGGGPPLTIVSDGSVF